LIFGRLAIGLAHWWVPAGATWMAGSDHPRSEALQ
jgi:hypothetical protein